MRHCFDRCATVIPLPAYAQNADGHGHACQPLTRDTIAIEAGLLGHDTAKVGIARSVDVKRVR